VAVIAFHTATTVLHHRTFLLSYVQLQMMILEAAQQALNVNSTSMLM
jgi:hypothetical protein